MNMADQIPPIGWGKTQGRWGFGETPPEKVAQDLLDHLRNLPLLLDQLSTVQDTHEQHHLLEIMHKECEAAQKDLLELEQASESLPKNAQDTLKNLENTINELNHSKDLPKLVAIAETLVTQLKK
jgi:DUF438 domain-containing protein